MVTSIILIEVDENKINEVAAELAAMKGYQKYIPSAVNMIWSRSPGCPAMRSFPTS